MKENFVIIALGSNLGDRITNLRNGIEKLRSFIDISTCSAVYSSAAILPLSAPQEWNREFYNCVFYGNTALSAEELLEISASCEAGSGMRVKSSWSPRYLDIDIIAYNDDIIATDALKVPHPLMQERLFVMLPLNDILPEWIHPVSKLSAKDIADNLNKETNNIQKLELKL